MPGSSVIWMAAAHNRVMHIAIRELQNNKNNINNNNVKQRKRKSFPYFFILNFFSAPLSLWKYEYEMKT